MELIELGRISYPYLIINLGNRWKGQLGVYLFAHNKNMFLKQKVYLFEADHLLIFIPHSKLVIIYNF